MLDFLLDQRKPLLRCGVGFLFHRLALDLELNQPAVEPVHRLGLGIDLHPNPGGRLVDEVDRLVRQEAVGNVAMRELRRGDDRRVRDLDAVVELVALLEPAQDGDRRLDRRLVDQHFLETALERGVLLDVLPVLVERRRADAMELAAGERRLQHVAGVDRALGLAGADHRVQLVDEDDRLAGVGGDVLQHGLQALLELAAVFGAGEKRRHVERQHALALQRLRHLAVDDALREPLDDRGLAHARLADQHRVVLGAPLQDLDRPPDLVVPPDHGVELAVAGAFGEVDRVLLQRLALALGLLRVHAAAATDGLDRALQRLLREPGILEQAARLAFVVGEGQQEELARDELVAALARLLVREIEEVPEVARNLDFSALALDLGQPADGAPERTLELGHGDAGARQERRRPAVVLLEHGGEQMLRLDEAVVVGERLALRLGERLLEFGGQLVETHRESPGNACVADGVLAGRFKRRRPV